MRDNLKENLTWQQGESKLRWYFPAQVPEKFTSHRVRNIDKKPGLRSAETGFRAMNLVL